MVSPQRRTKSRGFGVACALFKKRHIKAVPPFNGQYALHILMTVGGLLRIKRCAICKFSGAGTPSLVPALCENGKAVLKILAPAQNKKTNSNYHSRAKLVLLLQPNSISAATESDAGKPFLSLARSDGAQVLPDVLRRQESAANSSPSGDIK